MNDRHLSVMMKSVVAGLLVATAPSLAVAHSSVRPRESTEGSVAKPQGDRGPASVTRVTAVAVATQTGSDDAVTIEAWLKAYDAAFNAKDLEKLATFYHPDVTIYEGGGINDGWADYRDRHLGPELKAFDNLQFGHRDIIVSILPGGQSAYVRSEYFLKARSGTREIDSSGLATYVLIKEANGWKIRHSHTSSRPRRPAGG